MAGNLTTSRTASQEGWQLLDEMLDDLERLAASSASEPEFYAQLFQRISPLGYTAAAVWRLLDRRQPRLQWSSLAAASEAPQLSLEANLAAVAQSIHGGEPRLLPASTFAATAAPLAGRSLIAPWSVGDTVQGALQVWLTAHLSAEAAEGSTRLLGAIGELVGSFHARQEQQRLRERLQEQPELEAFILALHASSDLRETAYRIANDGRLLLGCDRVAVAVRRGAKYKVLAVSGAEHIHRRAPTIRHLERLCQRVAATGEPLWHDNQPVERAPQLTQALTDYLELAPAVALAAIPLAEEARPTPGGSPADPGAPAAVLVCEQYSLPFDASVRQRIERLGPHCRVAFANALRLESIPAHRFWLAIGRDGWLGRWATRTTLALALLAAIVTALVVIPADIRVKASGELQPVVRREVFAPRDGVVVAVHVDHGEKVQAGEKLLEIRATDLSLELQKTAGELETTRKQLAAAQAERLQARPTDPEQRLRQRRLTADEAQFQQQVESLEMRLEMLQKQQADLIVRSPIAGDITTWNARQRLATRPLRRGDALLTVADASGPWQLELRVPSRRAGRLLAVPEKEVSLLPVSFALTTDPGEAVQGRVERVAQRVEVDAAGESFLLVTVAVPDTAAIQLVPGAAAVAHITCSRSSLGEAWFHEALDAARLWLPF